MLRKGNVRNVCLDVLVLVLVRVRVPVPAMCCAVPCCACAVLCGSITDIPSRSLMNVYARESARERERDRKCVRESARAR